MRYRVLLISISSILIAGCGSNASPPPANVTQTAVDVTQYLGMTKDEVIAARGAPEHAYTYPMSSTGSEFDGPLQNTYPLTNPANADVQIEELHWSTGDFIITLWFHQIDGEWRVLNAYLWHKDARF